MRVSAHLFILFLAIHALSGKELPASKPDTVKFTKYPPKIDGIIDDRCWNDSSSINLTDSPRSKCNIEFNVCRNRKSIFCLLRFPAKTEARNHKLWYWDKQKEVYIPGNEKEETVYLSWNKVPPQNNYTDLWIWRAGRTDPAGFAEDYLIPRNELSSTDDPLISKSLKPDKGKFCWYSRYFSTFAGQQLPRFYQISPSESQKDVKAKGVWENGFWTIEFSRAIDTGNPDDLSFNLPGKYIVTIYLYSIGKSPSPLLIVHGHFHIIPKQ